MLKGSHFQKYIFESLEETCQANGCRTHCTDLLEGGKKRKGKKKEKKVPKKTPTEPAIGMTRKILVQKSGARGECCSPDKSLAEGQHQHQYLNGFALAKSRPAGKCRFGTETLAPEECQRKSWGLGEKSHTIFGRCTECLSSNTLSLKLLGD